LRLAPVVLLSHSSFNSRPSDSILIFSNSDRSKHYVNKLIWQQACLNRNEYAKISELKHEPETLEVLAKIHFC
jgi:hypothetical protein